MDILLLVFVASALTALATGLGALPLLFRHKFSAEKLGLGHAIAAGLMLAASIGLVVEGFTISNTKTSLGMALGVLAIILAHKIIGNREEEFSIGNLSGKNALQALMVVGVMTAHSFAEGIGIGVAYGGGESFGLAVSLAIAIHNIPEGLAIALILVPMGTSVTRAFLWSVFSSLPQPLVAVPAFLFVLWSAPLLPFGLGFAAGAMIWMIAESMLPQAAEEAGASQAATAFSISLICMLCLQGFVL